MDAEKEMAAIRAAKKELRKMMKEKLKNVDKDDVGAQCMYALLYYFIELLLEVIRSRRAETWTQVPSTCC
jgi:hypothetical protein